MNYGFPFLTSDPSHTTLTAGHLRNAFPATLIMKSLMETFIPMACNSFLSFIRLSILHSATPYECAIVDCEV